jgi:hypothetical protein
MVGDIMLGRAVATIATGDPADLFREVRSVVRGADLANPDSSSCGCWLPRTPRTRLHQPEQYRRAGTQPDRPAWTDAFLAR